MASVNAESRTFEYSPDQRSLRDALDRLRANRVLLVGGDEVVDLTADETRHAAQPPESVLPNGMYILRHQETLDVMACSGGAAPNQALEVPHDQIAGGDFFHTAVGWFEYLWPNAQKVSGGPKFAKGDLVRLAGDDKNSGIGSIESVHRVDGRNSYRVLLNGRLQRVGESGLIPVSLDENDPATWFDEGIATARQFSASLTQTKLTNPLTDTIYSYLSSKTIFRPYQFRPVLKMLHSAHQRLLIADEVGLGKTIEAGLIWTELETRNRGLDRVLVVCPAALVLKWQDEMRRRFDRDLVMLDSEGLQRLSAQFESGHDDTPIHGVVSLERLRSSRSLADLESLNPRFDLIIVDEAHYLRNTETLSHQLGEALSSWADALVFLSATPLNLGNDDLFNLLNLLVEDVFSDPGIFPLQIEPNRHLNAAAAKLRDDSISPTQILQTLNKVHGCDFSDTVVKRVEWDDLQDLLSGGNSLGYRERTEAKRLLAELNTLAGVVSRTRKVDVLDARAVREPISIQVDWTAAELDLYKSIERWALARAKRLGCPPGFATQMPLRQAASCLPAIYELALPSEYAWSTDVNRVSGYEDFNDVEIDADLGEDQDRDLSDMKSDENWEEVKDIARSLGSTDTKFDCFVEALRKLRAGNEGQTLVFSFFLRTISYLERRLREAGWKVKAIHGRMRVDERQMVMDSFRNGEFEILLSSEVGSEGLDFEFCDAIVNYDLPWNPMRVEQRIGRLDRFGQTSDKIFILNFQVPGTIETDIFDRLYKRIKVFEESIGELEPILREELSSLQRIVLDPHLSMEQRQTKIDELGMLLEERRLQLEDISEADHNLAGLDHLLIDGFEEDTDSRGGFVGPQELRVLLEEFFSEDATRATLRSDDTNSKIWHLQGDDVLAERVGRVKGTRTASLYSRTDLVLRLRDEESIPVTFDNSYASQHSIELISLRHPIVRAATEFYSDREKGYLRATSIQLGDDLRLSQKHLVVVYLAQTTGLRPSIELWPISINLETNNIDPDLGYDLLAALAHGKLRDGSDIENIDLNSYLDTIDDEAERNRYDIEAQKSRANEALVDARIASQLASYESKIRKAKETLKLVETDRRSTSIQRLHRGRIHNLEQKIQEVVEEAESKREFALTLEPVAAAVVFSKS